MTKGRSGFLGFDHWSLVILVLLAFSLRMVQLGQRALWLDEATSAWISGMGWHGAMAYLRSAPWEHPPVYYLSLYPWQVLAGTSEFAFRFYSVFWGTLFIPLLYVLVKRLVNRQLALLASLLAVFSPYMVAYAREARMYSLFPTLALLALLCFWMALERKRPLGWWLAYLGLMILGVLTHYYFALIWLVTTLFLVYEWARRRRVGRWVLAVQGAFLLVAVVWIVSAPGLRQSLLDVGQTVEDFSLVYKLETLMPSLMLSEIDASEVSPVVYVLAAAGWVLVGYGVVAARRGPWVSPRVWWLLVLLLAVPLAGSLVLLWVKGRHLGFVLIPAFAFMALGLADLGRRGWLALAVGILAFLLPSTYGLAAHYGSSNGDFDQALAYIDEWGQAGDAVILTHPHQWPLADHYNAEGWPIHYLPPTITPPTPAETDEALGALSREYDRLWLGPVGAWTADPDQLADRWLAAHAFQATKVWFPDSTSATLYLTDLAELIPTESPDLVWGGGIQLLNASTSARQVRPGAALRVRLNWRPESAMDRRYEVSLLLLDDQDRVWAERRSEPCGGWCPTDQWQAGQLYRDQHGLVIPPGTPPGDYRLAVSWDALGGGAALPVEEDNQRVARASLAQVSVRSAGDDARLPDTLPNESRVTFGDEISLLGFEPAEVQALPGAFVHWETYWLAGTKLTEDYVLELRLVDGRNEPVTTWTASPAADAYPTGQWRPGEFLRGQHDVALPDTLAPGRYQVWIALVSPEGERLPLGGEVPKPVLGGLFTWRQRPVGDSLALTSVTIADRPRNFDLPAVEHALNARVGRRARLVGYDLDRAEAHPGDRVRLTAIWQADGPMTQAYKVFVHLIDSDGAIRAQHDGPPGGGCCPPTTWAEGEVIVDEHLLVLDADLPPGIYQIVLGMYNEETDFRLPAYSAAGEELADGQVPVAQVAVVAVQASGQELPVAAASAPRFDVRIFLPVVRRDEP